MVGLQRGGLHCASPFPVPESCPGHQWDQLSQAHWDLGSLAKISQRLPLTLLVFGPSAPAQVLAILMDVFTDVEIFCDILEAANKRGVFVCVLLDQGGVKLFQEMCDKVQISDSHLKVGAPGESPEGTWY